MFTDEHAHNFFKLGQISVAKPFVSNNKVVLGVQFSFRDREKEIFISENRNFQNIV